MKTAVVVPTNRPERIESFCKAWASQLNKPDVRLIIVEDFPEPKATLPGWVEHYCHQDIDALGKKGLCIPRRSGGVRSFGFWLAGQSTDLDMILTLDDDVTPLDGVDIIAEHWRQLETPRHRRWWPTADVRTRGFPYSTEGMVKPVLNHGLWRGMPDLDALEQMKQGELVWKPPTGNNMVPPRMYYTMCIMNVAFRPGVAPYLFMAPFPDGFKRWDDIWGGLIFKRLADLMGWVVTSGEPVVRHERASTVQGNLSQEFLGYGLNETFWKVLDGNVTGSNPQSIYNNTATAIEREFPQLSSMTQAMRDWAKLW